MLLLLMLLLASWRPGLKGALVLEAFTVGAAMLALVRGAVPLVGSGEARGACSGVDSCIAN